MRTLLCSLCAALLAAFPSVSHADVFVTGGVSSAGVAAGVNFRNPEEGYQMGVRGAFLPGVHAVDAHLHFYKAKRAFPTYFGPEIVYLYDTVVLTDKEFTRFEWVALQCALGKEFRLSPRVGLAFDVASGFRVWSDTKFIGAGAPIDIPVSLSARAELSFGV